MRLLFGLPVPAEAETVEIRPVLTGSSRPRPIFRGPLKKRGIPLDDNEVADILARDKTFWRWIYSEERARRLRTERQGLTVRFKLALFFFDQKSKLIEADPARDRTSLITHSDEAFDNESDLNRPRAR